MLPHKLHRVVQCASGLAAWQKPLFQPARFRGSKALAQKGNYYTQDKNLPRLNFGDHARVYGGTPTIHLLRAWFVFQLCGIPAFVRHAEGLLRASRAVLGDNINFWIIKNTFFGHFTAGETPEDVRRTMHLLQQRGVGAIIDYAAEDDVRPAPNAATSSTSPSPPSPSSSPSAGSSRPPESAAAGSAALRTGSVPSSSLEPAQTVDGQQQQQQQQQRMEAAGAAAAAAGDAACSTLLPAAGLHVVARTYDYESETACDRHVQTFLDAIDTAASLQRKPGFAAIKMTALGNPRLLERVATAVTEVRSLFKRFDADASGFLDRAEFEEAYAQMMPPCQTPGGEVTAQYSSTELDRIFERLDPHGSGRVDYVSWCQRLSLSRMPAYAQRIRDAQRLQQQQKGRASAGEQATSGSSGNSGGSGDWRSVLCDAALTQEEVQLVKAMRRRLRQLAESAAAKGVTLMVDAEHTYFQPAIDHLTLELMREHNRERVVVMNTYQAYLVDSLPRLRDDLERARREDHKFGCKLVRGAYLELERKHASRCGRPSPVWDTLQQTHDNYNACLELLLPEVATGRCEALLGTHNRGSVERAVARMAELSLDPQASGVHFGQLLGMSDHLTFTLGMHGYSAHKYVPYGRVQEVVPYLLRRVSENASILDKARVDVPMIRAELWRRMRRVLRAPWSPPASLPRP